MLSPSHISAIKDEEGDSAPTQALQQLPDQLSSYCRRAGTSKGHWSEAAVNPSPIKGGKKEVPPEGDDLVWTRTRLLKNQKLSKLDRNLQYHFSEQSECFQKPSKAYLLYSWAQGPCHLSNGIRQGVSYCIIFRVTQDVARHDLALELKTRSYLRLML